MGASSTGGGTTRGCGGLDMDPWTGASLGIFRRVDGDEDLAHRVLAMAGQRNGRRCVRLAEVEGRGRQEGALAWLLLVPF